MAIRPSYQLALDMFEIDDEAMSLRSEVWRFLGPLMDEILDRHFAKVLKYTPFYDALIREKGDLWRGIIIRSTARLFLNAFDDEFVDDVRKRVDAEIELGCDMRTRGTLTQSILTNFNRALLGRRYGISRRKALRLTDVAERILMMDTAIAMGLHYRAEVVDASGRGNEILQGINDFGEAVKTVRSTVAAAVASLAENADKLSGFAGVRRGRRVPQGAPRTAPRKAYRRSRRRPSSSAPPLPMSTGRRPGARKSPRGRRCTPRAPTKPSARCPTPSTKSDRSPI